MTAKPMFEVDAETARNLLRIRYLGVVTPAGMQECCAVVEKQIAPLQAGFTALTDLSELESMDLDCVTHLTKIMDQLRAKGVGTVIRIIPDREKDIGFRILSIIHLRRGVKIITCDTRAEAERAMGLKAK
jgi:hypothetical protein